MSEFVCSTLTNHHDRKRFDCGTPALNEYLARTAGQDLRRKAAAVFILSPKSDSSRVAGYYTLSSASITLSSLPQSLAKRLPRYPEVPAILIGRLARDTAFPGVGSLLIADALKRCVRVTAEVAASVIIVDSKGEDAARFYGRFGFQELPHLPHRMFLPVATAEKLVQ